MSSKSITSNHALVALYDTAMISELFSVMGLVFGTRLNCKVAPDDAIYPLMNEGLNKLGEFNFGSGAKRFVDIERWTSRDGAAAKERDIVAPGALPEIDEYISRLMLEGVKITDVGIAPLQLRPGAFHETPGVILFSADGYKPKSIMAPVRVNKLLALTPALETERWQLVNSLQEKFGKTLSLVFGSEPESMAHYSTHGPRIVVEVRCGDVSNVLDAVFEVDNYVLQMKTVCDALDFMGVSRVIATAPEITPITALSAEEKLAVLRTRYPDWGKW